MSTNTSSPALEEAIALLQRGETVQAEQRMRRHVDEARDTFGPGTKQVAAAQYELGAMFLYLGQDPQAADALRSACQVNIPDDSEATRDRLTYLMNLGEVLERMGELAEAEQVLREGLAAREEFYGRQHPGYAFGLEPLAAVMLQAGDTEQALRLIDETVDNFWRNGHPRIATAFASRAEILKTAGSPVPPFEGLEELPDNILGELAEATIGRVREERPEVGRAMLDDLLRLVSSRLGETHDATLRVLSALANVCRPLGDHEARQQAIRRAIAACETRGQPQQAIAAMLGLALALGEAGQHEQAVETYQRAIEQADAIGEAQLQSQALRNYGLLLAELEREADAEQTLRLAVGTGRRANEDETLGRAQVALGIFLQHHGRLDEAGRLLAEAIDRLEAAHPDAVCARSHLQAVESGASCGCGDMQEALAEAFRRFVLERLPAGLIKELRVEIDEGTFNVHVELASEPTEEEQELLTTTLQHAQQQFRTRLSKGPY